MGIRVDIGRELGNSAASAARAIESAFSDTPRIFIDVTKAIDSSNSAITRFAASIYAAEKAVGLLRAALFNPFQNFTSAVVSATEANRGFEISLGAIVGGLTRARDVNAELFRASQGLPQTIGQLREASLALADNPALNARLSFGDSVSDMKNQITEFSSMIQRLNVLSPLGDPQAALRGVRELVEGNTVSIRRRLGLSLKTMARQVAEDFGGDLQAAEEAITTSPSVAIKSLEKIADAFVPAESAQQTARLVSVRVEKIRESLQFALGKIGESGFYKDLSAKLEHFGKDLFNYFDSPEFQNQANRIGAGMTRVLTNMGRAIAEFLAHATGTSANVDSIGGTVKTLASAAERLGAVSEGLPTIGARIGDFVATLKTSVDNVVKEIARMSQNLAAYSNEGAQITRRASGYRYPSDVDMTEQAITNLFNKQAGRTIVTNESMDLRKYIAEREAAGAPTSELMRLDAQGVMGMLTGKGFRQMVNVPTLHGAGTPEDFFAAVRELMPMTVNSQTGTFYDEQAALQQLGRAGLLAPFGLRQPGESASSPATTRPSSSSPAGADRFASVPTLHEFNETEYTGPNFGAMLQAIGSLTGKLSEHVQRTPTELLYGQASGMMNENITGNASNPLRLAGVFDRFKKIFQDSADFLDKAIREGEASIAGAVNPDKDIVAMLDAARKSRANLSSRYAAALDALEDDLTGAAKDYGQALRDQLSTLPPEVALQLSHKIDAGATSLGDQVARILAAAGRTLADRSKAFGSGSLPLDVQLKNAEADRQRLEQQAVVFGRLGQLRPGMTQAEVEGAHGMFPASDLDISRAQLAVLQGQLGEQRGLFQQAQADYAKHPDERSLANLGVATQDLADISTRIHELEMQTDQLLQSVMEFGSKAQSALEDSLGMAIDGLITGTHTLQDALKSLAHNISSEFSHMAAHNIVTGLLGQNDPQHGGGLGGLLGGLLGGFLHPSTNSGGQQTVPGGIPQPEGPTGEQTAMMIALRLVGGLFGGIGGFVGGFFGGGTTAAADGAILPGGFTAFAGGGVAHRPTLGLIGERADGVPEAVVPMFGGAIPIGIDGSGLHAILPGNRKIPAAMRAFADGGVAAGGFDFGGGNAASVAIGSSGAPQELSAHTTVYVVHNKEEAARRGYKRMRNQLLVDVLDEFRPGGRGKKLIDRKKR